MTAVPDPRGGPHAHAPAQGLDAALHDVQPEAVAREAAFCRQPPAVERVEDVRRSAGSIPGPVVLDRQPRFALRAAAAREADPHRRRRAAVLQCVSYQVLHAGSKPRGIAAHQSPASPLSSNTMAARGCRGGRG